MREQWAFIERTAGRLNVSGEAIRKWRVRGVPQSKRLAMVDAAVVDGFDLDRRIFDKPPGPKTRQFEAAE
jgi:hypothetical protein